MRDTIESFSTVELIVRCAQDKKAEDLVVLEMTKITDFCDFFVIASAASHRQVHALADSIEEALFKKGIRLFRSQNDSEFSWVVLDFFDVVVHIFFAPVREFYGLERLWADAKKIDFENNS